MHYKILKSEFQYSRKAENIFLYKITKIIYLRIYISWIF